MSGESRAAFTNTLSSRPQLIGVVHLPALPGTARSALTLDEILPGVEREASAYAAGGVDALLIENYGDAPFDRRAVAPHVLTLLTRIGLLVRGITALPLGVNVLRNDGRGALAVAAAIGGDFVRVNVLAGVVATDQGLIQGEAAGLLRYRRELGADIAILADVDVKHGKQLWGDSLPSRAVDLVERALADALIVTGPATGSAAARADIETVRGAVPTVPVLIGSGLTAANASTLLPGTDGAIIGTAVKQAAVTANPVDPASLAELVAAARQAWQ